MRGVVLFLLLLPLGCDRTVLRTGRTPGDVRYTRREPAYLFGVVPARTQPACVPAVVDSRRAPLDLLLGVLTIGIYVPFTVTVTCAEGERVATP
jgi:hypothetical protein